MVLFHFMVVGDGKKWRVVVLFPLFLIAPLRTEIALLLAVASRTHHFPAQGRTKMCANMNFEFLNFLSPARGGKRGECVLLPFWPRANFGAGFWFWRFQKGRNSFCLSRANKLAKKRVFLKKKVCPLDLLFPENASEAEERIENLTSPKFRKEK